MFINKVRKFYLGLLRSDDLNRNFGGPLFVAILISTSILIAATWIRTENGLLEFATDLPVAKHEDFAAFYRGGEMAAKGEAADVYDYFRFTKGMSQENRALLFLNPPHSLLFYEPLSKLSYPAARGFFLAANILCLFLTVYLIGLRANYWPYVFVLLSTGTFYSLRLLQVAPIATFLLLFALMYSRTRPILCGLALCLLTIKPQYGILVPVYLLAVRDWRTFVVASLGTLALFGASVGLYGVATWQAFFASLSGGVHYIQFQMPQNMIVTIGQSLGKIGAGDGVRLGAQIVTLIICGKFVWAAARYCKKETGVALSMLAMCLAAPSFLFYDWIMYAAALLLLLKTCPRWTWSFQAVAGLLWTAPLVHDVVKSYNVEAANYFSSFMPLIVLATLLLASVTFFREKNLAASSAMSSSLDDKSLAPKGQ